MLQIRDNSSRAKQTISFFWLMLGITIVDMAAVGWQYFLLIDAQENPGEIDMSTLQTSDMLYGIVAIADFAIHVLTIVFFIMWFRRAYYNLHTLSWNNARYSEGWAAGSWFVPFINLFYPYQIMMDIWNGTQNSVKERLGQPQPSIIVGWWWAFYLIMSIFSNISARIGWSATEIGELITARQFEFVSNILTIPAIIFAVKLIQQTSLFEKELLIQAETPSDSIFSDNYIPPADNTELKPEI